MNASSDATSAPMVLRPAESGGREDDQPRMLAPHLTVGAVELEVVISVVGHYRTFLRLRALELLYVEQAAQLVLLVDRDDIAPTRAKTLGDISREHLVEEKPQPRAACSRRHAASATSASSRLRRMRSSTSSGNSL